MQALLLKTDKTEDEKIQKQGLFTYFLAYIFARTEQKLEPYCKIKIRILSFQVDEFLRLSVGEFLRLLVDELVSSQVDEFISWRVFEVVSW